MCLVLILIFKENSAYASRFASNYPCVDSSKTCIDHSTKMIEGQAVTRCWEYSYDKTCNYPSKDNCHYNCANNEPGYYVASHQCLLRDSLGNCVNEEREYSCKRWNTSTINKDKVRYGTEEREGEEQLICKGVPCIDGNCIDKSFDSNNEMMDSVSRLYAVSEMKGAKDLNTQLFAGYHAHCSKKATGYSNCCNLTGGGNNWGHNIGAKCTPDEKNLIEQRKRNLCIYVGKEGVQKLGVHVAAKHHFCCFGNMLNKVIQVEGRKQLGLNFGSKNNADCRGLTLKELLSLDFNKMDFSEFEAEILKKMKLPKTSDMQARLKSSMPNMQKPQEERALSKNKRDGFNASLQDDSWEAEEERRVEEERLAIERTRQAEEQRRQLAQEQERGKQRQEEEKKQKRMVKERELAQTRSDASLFNLVFYGKLKSLPYSSYRSGSYNYVRQIYRMRQEQEELITTLTKERNWDLQQILNSARFKELEALIVNYKNWVSGGKLGESVEVQQIHDNWRIHDDKADRLLKELANGNY
jgi:conjugal transfer mating pair stabilization protein TraN